MARSGIWVNYVIAMLFLVILSFLLPRFMPGNPLEAIYGNEALISMPPQIKAELVRRFSLDRPLEEQFVAYLYGLCRGELGYSYFYNAPVSRVIGAFFPWTLLLTGLALVFSTLLGVVLGIESGYRRNQPVDRLCLCGLMLFSGFPDFFSGILLLLVFGVTLGLAPLAGAVTPYTSQSGMTQVLDMLHHLVLPLMALVLARVTAIYLLVRVKEILQDVELPADDAFLQKYPHHLSGGEAQRVAIARALVLNPKVLIADEPTSALDSSVQAKILKLLMNLQEKKGLAILLITHDLALARKISDRLAIMCNGRIIEEGPTGKVLFHPQHTYTQNLLQIAPAL